jgi:hypothetical protein
MDEDEVFELTFLSQFIEKCFLRHSGPIRLSSGTPQFRCNETDAKEFIRCLSQASCLWHERSISDRLLSHVVVTSLPQASNGSKQANRDVDDMAAYFRAMVSPVLRERLTKRCLEWLFHLCSGQKENRECFN